MLGGKEVRNPVKVILCRISAVKEGEKYEGERHLNDQREDLSLALSYRNGAVEQGNNI